MSFSDMLLSLSYQFWNYLGLYTVLEKKFLAALCSMSFIQHRELLTEKVLVL